MNQNDSGVEAGRRLYFSSSQGPFYNAHNIFLFYGGGERGAVAANIVRLLRSDESILHVHGERGSGKTMLSLVVSDRLKFRYNTIRYDVPELSASLLLRHLLIELLPQQAGMISATQAQKGVDSDVFERALDGIVSLLSNSKRKPLVLVIDSNNPADESVMHVLQALTKVRSDERPVVQCVMFHRTSGDELRAVSAYREFSDQENHFTLRRLTLAEINEYLCHHMLLFDFTQRNLFTREMAYFIADRSEGIFRSINTLARNAFTIAHLEGGDKLSMSHLLMAGLPSRPEPSTESRFLAKHRGRAIALLGICVVASTAVAVFLLR